MCSRNMHTITHTDPLLQLFILGPLNPLDPLLRRSRARLNMHNSSHTAACLPLLHILSNVRSVCISVNGKFGLHYEKAKLFFNTRSCVQTYRTLPLVDERAPSLSCYHKHSYYFLILT